jgi:chromosome segregation ATPase
VTEKEQKTKEIQQENADLKSEIERTRKECDVQVLLLQEDNETTRMRLQEVQEELESLHTETDGGNPEFEEISRDFEELKTKSQKHEDEFRRLKDSHVETARDFNNEKNKRLKLEKEFEEKCSELQNSQKDVEKFRELLRTVEEKFQKKSEKVRELEGICKSGEEKNEHREAKYSQALRKLEAKIQNYLGEIKDAKEKLDESNKQVLGLNTELEKRVKVDGQVLNRIEHLKSSLGETWSTFADSNSKDDQLNSDESMGDKTNAITAVDGLCKRLEALSGSFREEREKSCSLEQTLQAQQTSVRRCSACEKRRNENASLVENLEEASVNHRKELDRLKESMNSESQTLKSQAEEVKLKLTSKVILLQSDISELNAKHERELGQVHEQHKKEVSGI